MSLDIKSENNESRNIENAQYSNLGRQSWCCPWSWQYSCIPDTPYPFHILFAKSDRVKSWHKIRKQSDIWFKDIENAQYSKTEPPLTDAAPGLDNTPVFQTHPHTLSSPRGFVCNKVRGAYFRIRCCVSIPREEVRNPSLILLEYHIKASLAEILFTSPPIKIDHVRKFLVAFIGCCWPFLVQIAGWWLFLFPKLIRKWPGWWFIWHITHKHISAPN